MKNNKLLKNLIFIIVLIAILVFAFFKLDIVSTQTFHTVNNDKKQIGTINFGIYTKTIMNKTTNDKYKSGILYEDASLPIYENENCYDVLVRLSKENKIVVDAVYSDTYDTAYVKGIDDLYEFDYGDLSGWIYSINKVQPSVGCSQTYPKDGDTIRWHYTTDLGKDIVEW